jgi:hypothetical protein
MCSWMRSRGGCGRLSRCCDVARGVERLAWLGVEDDDDHDDDDHDDHVHVAVADHDHVNDHVNVNVNVNEFDFDFDFDLVVGLVVIVQPAFHFG